MLELLFSDTRWIYTAIAGSLIGAAFLAYFQGTTAGIWCYAKFDNLLDYFVNRWGWGWFEQPTDAWRSKYPHITAKLDQMETRIAELEIALKDKK